VLNIRKTRKFKEKPAIFAFGHIMLPLVGILALGLLILGVRLLFITPGSSVTYPDSSGVSDAGPDAIDQAPVSVVAEEPQSGEVVAVPVQEGQAMEAVSPVSPKNAPKTTPKTDTSTRASSEKQPLPSVPVSSGIWAVQIGAFTTKDAAEALASDATSKNYQAFVVKAEVGGKTYYRVRIGAGAQRSDAEKLAADLAEKGYPTLVARQE